MTEKIVKIKVISRSSIAYIQENLMGELRVKVKSPPVGGQANQEVVELLAKYYNVSKSNIEIIRGRISKNKEIRVIY